MPVDLTDLEDAKLLTLARASRARAAASEGAAIRDTDGRTYSAANVDLPTLQLSALQVAVAMAVSSGVRGLEAALVVTDGLAVDDADVTVVREFGGSGLPVYRADAAGVVADAVST